MRNKVPFFLSLVLILLLGLRCGSKEGCGDNELLGDWELIWYDEFESGIIDTSKWCYDKREVYQRWKGMAIYIS